MLASGRAVDAVGAAPRRRQRGVMALHKRATAVLEIVRVERGVVAPLDVGDAVAPWAGSWRGSTSTD